MDNIKLGIKENKLDIDKKSGKRKLKAEIQIKKEIVKLENDERREVKKSNVLTQEKFPIIQLEDINTFLEYKNKSKKKFCSMKRIINLFIYSKIRKKMKDNKIYIIPFSFKRIIFIIYFLQIILNSRILFSLCLNEYNFSNVTLKIEGIGIKNILSSDFGRNFPPSLIYINGVKQPEINNMYGCNDICGYDYRYDLNQTDNIVELIWFNSISDCNHMFYYCSDINEINLYNFDTSNVTDMKYMFYGCSSLTSLNLSNFNTSKVTSMNNMFAECSRLISINLSNFDTSKVTDMSYMFSGCSTLNYLNLSNFDTSKVTDINSMFSGCSTLNYLNLSNFDTSNVEYMNYMFRGCSSLIKLNLYNFNTSKVKNMHNMFENCSKLSSLNLSNFDTSNTFTMAYMFCGCINLGYINLKNFKNYSENSFGGSEKMFYQVPENVVICINENSNILSELVNQTCNILTCSDDWETKQIKTVNKTNICSDDSNKNILYKYEYNQKYYEKCLYGNLTNVSPIKNCSCDLEKCSICPNEPLKENLCIKCNNNYYPKENDILNIDKYVTCYKDPIGYYLDKNESIYKKCHYACETCESKGNNDLHNCLKCNYNYSYNIRKNNYFNCYNCSNYHYFDDNNKFHCTLNKTCPKAYPKLIINETKCVKNTEMKKVIENIMIKYDKNDTVEKTKEEEIEYYDTILEILETGFTSEGYDTSDLDNGKEEIIETEKMRVTFTTTENQKNNTNDNMTSIDLGECEKILRKFYNLSDNDKLYIKKLDIVQEGIKTPKIEYDVYSKLSGTNLIKLNLSVCQNSKISLFIPIIITENLDKLNASSGYFNDICYIATSDSGTDISLEDRKKDFIDNNKTVCQDECDFSEYDYEKQKAKCTCKVKESSSSIIDMCINKTKLLENFKNIKNFANLNLLVCRRSLFNKEGMLKNIGCYILISIIIFHIVNIIIFYVKQLELIKSKIKNIINAKNNLNIKNKKLKGKVINIENKNKSKNIKSIKLDKNIKNHKNKKKKVNEYHKTKKNKNKNKTNKNNIGDKTIMSKNKNIISNNSENKKIKKKL